MRNPPQVTVREDELILKFLSNDLDVLKEVVIEKKSVEYIPSHEASFEKKDTSTDEESIGDGDDEEEVERIDNDAVI
jgi:hypothetical protein